MFGAFDLSLVAMSYAISVFGSYTGLVLAGKIGNLHRNSDRVWLVCAAVALGGAAIWSMHFIGMLAYKSPLPVSYDPMLTLASMAVSIVCTGTGLYLVIRQRRMKIATLLGAGLVMGLGVAGMHYTGMAAMLMAGEMHHDSAIVALSVVIAVVASTAALWLAFTVRTVWQKVNSAFVMGLAVCGMHYTAMYGVTMAHDGHVAGLRHSMILANELAGYIVVATMVVLATGLLATFAIDLAPPRRAANPH